MTTPAIIFSSFTWVDTAPRILTPPIICLISAAHLFHFLKELAKLISALSILTNIAVMTVWVAVSDIGDACPYEPRTGGEPKQNYLDQASDNSYQAPFTGKGFLDTPYEVRRIIYKCLVYDISTVEFFPRTERTYCNSHDQRDRHQESCQKLFHYQHWRIGRRRTWDLDTPAFKHFGRFWMPGALLRSCKTVYDEFLPLLYVAPRLVFMDTATAVQFVETVRPETREHIKGIEFSGSAQPDSTDQLQVIFKSLNILEWMGWEWQSSSPGSGKGGWGWTLPLGVDASCGCPYGFVECGDEWYPYWFDAAKMILLASDKLEIAHFNPYQWHYFEFTAPGKSTLKVSIRSEERLSTDI
jgi:hypothetical protein